MGTQSFFKTLQERKIGQTVVVYLGTAWVLAEAFSFFSQRYDWPSFLFDQLVVVALCGLPAVIATRWFHHPDVLSVKRKLMVCYATNLALLVICSWLVYSKSEATIPIKKNISEKSVAVLPFSNLSKDPDQEYFGDGIMEDIISKLYKIADIQVTSRTSALMYKNTSKNIQQIAGELGVAYVVEGSVRKSGDKVRVTARLIKADNDQNVWTETFDKPLQDIFYLQNELSEKIAEGLKATITSSEHQRITKIPTGNTKAYEYYQLGRYYLSRPGRGNILQSKEQFDMATREDPNYALAYVGLAEYYVSLVDWGYASSSQLTDSIRRTLDMALQLDNNLGEAYASLGAYHLFFTHRFMEAQEAFEKAIQLNPGYDFTYYHYAALCVSLKQFDKGNELIARGIQLNPLSTKFQGYKIQFYSMERDYRKAEFEIKNLLKVFPEDDFIAWNNACVHVQPGKYGEAVKIFLNRKIPSKENNWALGYAYAKMGETEKARQILNFLIEKSKTTYLPPTFIALIYAGLNEPDQAMDQIEKGFKLGDCWIIFYGVHPWFDSLRSNPRFQAIMKELNQEK